MLVQRVCACGCGKPSGVYRRTDRRTGAVKGQPRRFLPGHSPRPTPDEPADVPAAAFCRCGCGQPSGFYKRTDRRAGRIKGHPRRFLPNHSQRAPDGRQLVTRRVAVVDRARFVPPKYAECDEVPAGCPLSNAEYRVISTIARGLTYKEAARELGISKSTIRSHMARIFEAFGLTARGQTAAVVLMKDMGWLGAPPREPPASDPPVPVPHLAYCIAFTRLVLDRTREAEQMVTLAFMLMCMHSGFRPVRERRTPDIDALLLRMARGCQRPIP